MKYYLKFVLVGIFCGFFCILGYAVRNEKFLCSDIVLLFGMGEVNYFMQYLSNIAYWFMPLLFFQIFFGTYLYRHFCSASIYYFSRYPQRIKWFIKEVICMYIFCIVYLIAMIVSGIISCTFISDVTFDIRAIEVLAFYVLIYSLYLFVTTIGINIVAILCNSNVGFMVVEGINMFFIATFAIVGEFFAPEGVILNEYEWLLKVNPIYYLIFDSNKDLNDFYVSIIVYLIFAALVLCFGCFVINKHNFIETNKEIGGI